VVENRVREENAFWNVVFELFWASGRP
jgi:hypothetical protein